MSWLGSIAGGETKPSDANPCKESSCNRNSGSFWGMVQKQVTAQGWLGSTPEGRRPLIRFSLRSQRPGGAGNHGPNQLLSGRVRPLLNGRPVQKRKKPVHEGPAQTMASPQAVPAFRVQALGRSRGAAQGLL